MRIKYFFFTLIASMLAMSSLTSSAGDAGPCGKPLGSPGALSQMPVPDNFNITDLSSLDPGSEAYNNYYKELAEDAQELYGNNYAIVSEGLGVRIAVVGRVMGVNTGTNNIVWARTHSDETLYESILNSRGIEVEQDKVDEYLEKCREHQDDEDEDEDAGGGTVDNPNDGFVDLGNGGGYLDQLSGIPVFVGDNCVANCGGMSDGIVTITPVGP